MYNIRNTSIKNIPSIKEERSKILSRMGIETVEDIIKYFPKKYDDRRNIAKIIECVDDEKYCVKAKVLSKSFRTVRKNLNLVNVVAYDETGKLHITYFNQKYMYNNIKEEEEYIFFGKVKREYQKTSMTNPVTEKEERYTGCIVPMYKLKSGISQLVFTNAVKSALSYIDFNEEETLPSYIRKEHELCDMLFAYKNIHFPSDDYSLSLAKRRLVFEELLIFELGLLSKKEKNINNKGIKLTNLKIVEELADILPYELTGAQKRVIREIAKDMRDGKQLNRLVQGDVGSGKTIVAAATILMALNCGYQGAIMAPTEILAHQHYDEMSEYFKHFGYTTALLTGTTKKKEKDIILEKLKCGEINVLIGTHAIIEENVVFKNLAVCVTDEQHRFGVNQRGLLYKKGENPHFLVMSATPIPRTLALIMYSDLDISIIDELPPGRKPVKTIHLTEKDRKKTDNFILKELNEKNQIYIVCPLVEDSDDSSELKDAVSYHKNISEKFPDASVALIHGKMKSKEKDEIMLKFKRGEIDILVSTTVIEVGVNVPNATVMMIENAERFGLSQLHQLRGRVGRGNKQSYNILITDNESKATKERMKIMVDTNDGFKISECDLKLRGPGDFFGTEQSGFIDMKIADLMGDVKTLSEAMKTAVQILKNDPLLEKDEHKLLKENVIKMFSKPSFVQ